MKKYISISQIIHAVTGLAILGLLLTVWNQKANNDKLSADNNFYKAAHDTMRVEINNKTNEVIYHKQLFQGSQDDIKLLKNHNTELYELAKNKEIQTVIQTKIKTVIDTFTKEVVIIKDSIRGEVRKASIANQFYTADITSYRDSTALKLNAWSPLTLTVEKDGKLKASTPVGSPITITELNGFNKVEKQKKNRWWIPLGIGIIGGIVTTQYITNN